MDFNGIVPKIHDLQQLQISSYIHVACFALLALDWFLLLGKEVDFIWSGPLNLGAYLFFLIRYGAFVDAGLFLYPLLHRQIHVFISSRPLGYYLFLGYLPPRLP